MTFKKANDIISRRYSCCMKGIPTEEEIEEAEKAFEVFDVREGLDNVCKSCMHKHECSMPNYTVLGFYKCNFYEEAKEVSQKEVMDAVRVIGEYCANTQCDKCPYDDGYCMFEQVAPYLWEDRIRRFGNE